MFTTPESFSEIAGTTVETALRLAQISVASTERLIKIHIDATKQILEQAADNAKSLSSVRDVQEAVSLRNKLAESTTESFTGYGRTVYEAVSQVQGEMSELFEERLTAYNKSLVSALDKAAKSAPAGTDIAVAAVKSSVAATAAAVDSLTKAAKQVADFADASVKAATTATADAVKTASKKAATN